MGTRLTGVAGVAIVLAITLRVVAQAPVPSDTPSPNVPASEAVPVQNVPSPAAPSHAPDQITWALIGTYILQYLKKSPWFPLISETTSKRAQAQVGFILALLTTAGVTFAISGSVFDSSGASVTVTGVSLHAVKDVIFQWAAQQAWYQALVKPNETRERVRDADDA